MFHAARALFVLACTLVAAPALHAGALLNEFLAGPASDWDGNGAFSSRDDEWVEIVNGGSTTIDLSTYFLTDGGDTPRYRFSGTLAPAAYATVYGSDAYAWERAEGFPAFGLSLGNSGDTVKLWQIVGPDTVLVDSQQYPSHTAAADRAQGRIPDSAGDWVLLDAMNPYAGTLDPQGTGCAPSPGATNVCGSTPTRNSTWGQVKTTYR